MPSTATITYSSWPRPRCGFASFAVSADDIARWDLRGKRLDQPRWQMAGGARRTCKVYRGGIDLGFDLPKLLDSVLGFNGVKIKIGQPDLAEDVERIRAVRDLIGPDGAFMADANYSMDVDQAIEAARAFASFDLLWLQVPIIPDDCGDYAQIAAATGMPLAMGENMHTIHEFG